MLNVCFCVDTSVQQGLAVPASPNSRKQVQFVSPPDLLQPSRPGVDLLQDPVVGIIKSLNRYYKELKYYSTTGFYCLMVKYMFLLLSFNLDSPGSVWSGTYQLKATRDRRGEKQPVVNICWFWSSVVPS